MRNVAIRFLISLICSTVYCGGTLRNFILKTEFGEGPYLELIKLSLVVPFLPGHRAFHDTKQKIGHFLKRLDRAGPL